MSKEVLIQYAKMLNEIEIKIIEILRLNKKEKYFVTKSNFASFIIVMLNLR